MPAYLVQRLSEALNDLGEVDIVLAHISHAAYDAQWIAITAHSS